MAETKIPQEMIDDLRAYVNDGRPTSHFLTMVLCNDLRGSIQRADLSSRRHLVEIVLWLAHEANAPAFSWGSTDRVNSWVSAGGWRGKTGFHHKSWEEHVMEKMCV